ncbi:hypothetical protein Peur_021302 [Populus x canadensis]
MGCICSKVSRATKYLERRVKRKETTKPARRLSKSDEVVVEVDGNANGSTASLISDQPGNDNAESTPVSYDEGEKKAKIEQVNNHQRITSIVSMSNGERGAQVVAGWPSWLTSVAGEAINGWVPRRADSFEKLDKVEQLHKIFKLCGSPSDEYWKRSKLPHATIFKPQHPYKRCVTETFKDFPSSALALLDVLLAVEPEARGTALSALDSEFFTTKPLPCDPSTLPKHPPTKEFDVKFRDEDARRRRATGGKGRGYESTRRGSKESKVMPAPDANAELQASIQKRQGQSKQISISEIYNHEEDGVSRSPVGPAKGTARNIYSHSGQSVHPMNLETSHNMNINETFRAPGQDFISSRQAAELRAQRSFIERGAVQLYGFSNSVAVRGDSQFHGSSSTNLNSHWPEGSFNARCNSLDDSSHGQLGRPNFSNKKPGLDSTTGNSTKKSHVHYSGPLVPRGGNIEEMLKEHEKQIQRAVRKARLDKNTSERGHTESLFYHGRINGR